VIRGGQNLAEVAQTGRWNEAPGSPKRIPARYATDYQAYFDFEMALPLNIDDLIHQRKVESARIEYKKDWNPEKVLHSVCAFANDIDNWGGGYIILGVEEKNGMPVLPPKGIQKESVDAVNRGLLNVCNLIEGRYVPVVSH